MLALSRSAKALLGVSTIGALSLSDPTFAAPQTFLGNAANNALGGQLQVQITVDTGKIVAITTPVVPGGRNGQYASYAVPLLTQEALTAQSANIQGISGASYISSAWKQSLASAIAKAGSAIGTTTPAPVTTTPAPVATPARTIAPAPAQTVVPRYGGDDGGQSGQESEGSEHEGGEGSGSDGNRATRSPRPERSRIVTPVRPLTPAPTKAPTPTPTSTTSATSAPPLGLTMGAGVIKKTITCVKGKLTKTVKATNPKCPTGYTLKKK